MPLSFRNIKDALFSRPEMKNPVFDRPKPVIVPREQLTTLNAVEHQIQDRPEFAGEKKDLIYGKEGQNTQTYQIRTFSENEAQHQTLGTDFTEYADPYAGNDTFHSSSRVNVTYVGPKTDDPGTFELISVDYVNGIDAASKKDGVIFTGVRKSEFIPVEGISPVLTGRTAPAIDGVTPEDALGAIAAHLPPENSRFIRFSDGGTWTMEAADEHTLVIHGETDKVITSPDTIRMREVSETLFTLAQETGATSEELFALLPDKTTVSPAGQPVDMHEIVSGFNPKEVYDTVEQDGSDSVFRAGDTTVRVTRDLDLDHYIILKTGFEPNEFTFEHPDGSTADTSRFVTNALLSLNRYGVSPDAVKSFFDRRAELLSPDTGDIRNPRPEGFFRYATTRGLHRRIRDTDVVILADRTKNIIEISFQGIGKNGAFEGEAATYTLPEDLYLLLRPGNTYSRHILESGFDLVVKAYGDWATGKTQLPEVTSIDEFLQTVAPAIRDKMPKE